MTIIQIIILLSAIIVVLLNVFLVSMLINARRREKLDNTKDSSFLLLQNQLGDLSRALDSRMQETTRSMSDSVQVQFRESKELIGMINKQMTEQLMEVQKGMVESIQSSKQVFTITEQLQNLEKVLKHQKQRGALGEAGLELILSNILPPDGYKLQYSFENGQIVDAVIVTKDGLIPVDAKFSLDNYNRVVNESDEARRAEYERDFKNDLKRRIDETAKYIKPKEGTLPFAFMFIPAEGIYYDLMINEVGAVKVNTRSLIDYAYRDKNVIIVSPTTFSAYLNSVLYGFRAFKIEQKAQDIIKNVESLRRHLGQYEEYFKKVGNSLSTTVNHYNEAYKSLGRIDKDVLHLTGESADIDPVVLSKPDKEE